MVSVELQLARITPGSPWSNPTDPPGGIPQLTEDDIRAAISIAIETEVFQAMMAKYCHDRRAIERLVHRQAKRSALEFLDRYPNWRITGRINQGIAESSVLFFLNPTAGQKRGDSGNAAHLGVDPKTWRKYYRSHCIAMSVQLFELEARGLKAVRKIFR